MSKHLFLQKYPPGGLAELGEMGYNTVEINKWKE